MRLLCSKRPEAPLPFLATAFRSPEEAGDHPARGPAARDGAEPTVVEYLEEHGVCEAVRSALESCLRAEPSVPLPPLAPAPPPASAFAHVV